MSVEIGPLKTSVYAAVATATATAIRIFFAIVALHALEYEMYDFDTAFLTAPVTNDAKVHVRQPPSLSEDDGKVWLPRKALYSLRKSSLWWFNYISVEMQKLVFTPVDGEVCLFINKPPGAYAPMYVDDDEIDAPDKKISKQVRDMPSKICPLRYLSEATECLGLQIIRDRINNRIFIHQTECARAILARLRYEDVNPVKTPMAPHEELPTTWDSKECTEEEGTIYIEETGRFNHLTTGTRPDMSYTASNISQANAGPSNAHLRAMKHLFRYLKGSLSTAASSLAVLPR